MEEFFFTNLLKDRRENTVLPLRRILVIEVTKQLVIVDRLRVNDVGSNLLILLLVFRDSFLGFVILKLAASVLENLPSGGFTSLSLTYEHVTVTGNLGFVELHDLNDEILVQKKVSILKRLFNSNLQFIIVVLWFITVWEEIDEEVVE